MVELYSGCLSPGTCLMVETIPKHRFVSISRVCLCLPEQIRKIVVEIHEFVIFLIHVFQHEFVFVCRMQGLIRFDSVVQFFHRLFTGLYCV